MFIRNKVKEVISKYNTNNPFEIIDILDITLVIYPLHNSINGFFACRGLSGSYIKNKYERQAYIFAAELLIDDNIHKLYPGESEAQIASRIGVHPWLFDLKFREKLR